MEITMRFEGKMRREQSVERQVKKEKKEEEGHVKKRRTRKREK